MNAGNLNSQLLGLSTLLQLEKGVRHAANERELGFILVNETRQLLQYQQAVLWRRHPSGRITIQAVSGLAQVEPNAPFIIWLKKFLRHELMQESILPFVIARDRVPEELRGGWEEWTSEQVLICPLLAPDSRLLGGLWLSRNDAWSDAEIALAERMSDAYAHAWAGLITSGHGMRSRLLSSLRKGWIKKTLAALFIASMFLPVRQSALAPAEVVAHDPMVVSAPIEGVIKHFHIQPNRPVHKGDLLFSLDDTTIRNRHEIAKKSLDIARADHLRAAQKAFADEKSKSELDLLRAEIEQKSSELTYTAELLEQVDVRAERDGIAVFNDPNDWLGKPVTVGEKVMMLAEPRDTELKIWLQVEDAINLEPGAEVRVFLNIDPTNPVPATLSQSSYEAQIAPGGSLAFPLKAGFDPNSKPPRLGLKGTAKIYGDRTMLFYYLMRRPISAARRMSGF